MRVLIVARGYPSEKYNLNGIFEFDQAKALASSGHEVILSAIDMRSLRRWRRWGYETLKKEGVNIEVLNIPIGNINKNMRYSFGTFLLDKFSNYIEKKYGTIDLVHAHFLGPGFITAKVFEKKGIPLVITEHLSSLNSDKIDRELLRIGEKTYKKFNKVIVVSEPLGLRLRKDFQVDPFIVPNIVDTDNFKYEDFESDQKHFDFVSTGGLIKRKGMDILIKAFYKAFKDDCTVRLYIFGDGPEKKNLEDTIKALKMSKRISLMGKVSRKEIANKMKQSQCFVLASKVETFGVVYIEAMAMGLPVIATKCGGPEDFINSDNGIIIDVDSEDKLVNSLIYMHENINSYNRKRISDNVKARFSSDAIAKELNEIYNDLTNNKLRM